MERAYRQNESHAPETELTPADSNATPMHAAESIESETAPKSSLKMAYLINKLNYINFQNGTIQVVMSHRRFERTLTAKARPLPCSDKRLECVWLEPEIIERLVDNQVIPVKPVIKDGNITNIEELGGYGPFLLAVSQRNEKGERMFPDTFGGGVGIERLLYSLCLGEKIKKVDDVTLFGKNPDSYHTYLF